MKDFVLKGHICYTKKSKEFEVCPNSFLVCKDGVSKGVYSKLPEEYKDLEVHSFRTNVNRFKWNKKEHRYNMLSINDVTSELEIFVYD